MYTYVTKYLIEKVQEIIVDTMYFTVIGDFDMTVYVVYNTHSKHIYIHHIHICKQEHYSNETL